MSPTRVIVESGHMIDAPDRPDMRFPPEAERRVAAAISDALSRLDVGPGSVVLTQGARGTDLLVAEEALRRGADVRVYLALPVDEFMVRSVDLPRSRWSERFREVLAASEAVVQSEAIAPAADTNVFDRNNRWVLDEATALASHTSAPAHAVVVWDGAEGDGAGGTAGFVHEARERGIGVDVINPRQAWRDPNVPYWERQPADEPKRLLALDGGGIRGIVALQILRRMEKILGHGDKSFVLADYFDYIGGTSTGAIIAASLALGHRVERIDREFRELGPKIFRRRVIPAGSARCTRTATSPKR